MPRERMIEGETVVDPFYPDGYVSSDQDRRQIEAQKEKYEASVQSINFKWPLTSFRRGFFEGNRDTKAAVREDIKTLLMTAKGERVMHKNMGTTLPILNGQLFEPTKKIELKLIDPIFRAILKSGRARRSAIFALKVKPKQAILSSDIFFPVA